MPLQIAPSFVGTVGPYVDAIDINGKTVKIPVQAVVLVDETGVPIGTDANPLKVETATP